MATYEEFTLDKKSDTTIQLELVDADGNPKDLSNYTAAASMKKNYTSTTEYKLTTLVVSPATDGIVTLNLSSDSADLVPAGRYVYDAYISFVDSNANNVREKILEGRIELVPNVTSFAGGGLGGS